jgi:tRNA 5-methylaminomethyl-2-thiouridine biosynthesis bifunctional protein
MPFTYRPDAARLLWMDDGMPFAEAYGDVYYSRANALGESSHVFLKGNDLGPRFRALQAGHFIIGELGFGGGLNFLNTCRLWCSNAPPAAQLHYIACERYPLRKNDLERLLRCFPELAGFATALLQLYPGHTSGTHQLELRYGPHRISLTLLHDDASNAFAAMAQQPAFHVDAWFLDGFAPKRNPEMWQAPLLRHLAALSHPDTTLASYSVFGSFRRQLADAGFICEKQRGFSGKRHMLRARRAPEQTVVVQKPTHNKQTICIIGGGLAGCSSAHALATAGWKVILVEQGPHLAMGASGNPQGILHFKPGTVDAPDNRFNLHAYLHAVRHYRSLELPPDIWSACGMLQLAHDHKLLKRFDTLAKSGMYAPEVLQVLNSLAASQIVGEAVAQPALYFPEAGWLCPPRLCAWYCEHPSIQVLTGHELTRLQQSAGSWELLLRTAGAEHTLHTPHVLLCNSADAWRFSQAQRLPLISNRGQVDLYAPEAARSLDSVICGQGYLIPAGADGQAVGGSFFLGANNAATREQNRQQHLQQLAGINPALAEHYATRTPVQQRIAERCTLPGRMPAVGALDAQELPGLWINVGHGSHGLARTPLCAALLASQLSGTPAPLAPELLPLLDPQRFLQSK